MIEAGNDDFMLCQISLCFIIGYSLTPEKTKGQTDDKCNNRTESQRESR
jgi:hypothetical protein